ncbi:MAG: ABC transporter ATP-binding protein, partial [Firmicutes bacterium]|nr:ABC transporter ATP-binding protein [Bacillota bacterium]
ITKQSYADRLDTIDLFENTQEEYAVLDRAGRVQIPRELLNSIGVSGNRLRLTQEDHRIIIEAAEPEKTE